MRRRRSSATWLLRTNHWIGLKLTGGPKSPRDAIGATVYLTANGFTQRQDVIAGGSFASSPDQRLHFGLGKAGKIDKIEVHWPSGLVETVPVTVVDQFVTVSEGKGTLVKAGR